MSAARLREAARVIRERAEAATPGPWHPTTTGEECGDHWGVVDYPTMNRVASIPSQDGENEPQRRPDAVHIATWHPAVALAVANLLDALADSEVSIPVYQRTLGLTRTILEAGS